MRTVITVRSAAELAGVGEPAIRRAIREDRLETGLLYFVGERVTTWIDLDSLVAAYRLAAADVERYETWLAANETEPPILVAGGTTWRLFDRGAVFHVPKPTP